MKILISHVYSSENKGDAALLSVLIKDIRRAFNDTQITILTLDKIDDDETFEGIPFKYSFMYFARDRYKNKILQPLYAIFVAMSTLSWAVIYRLTKFNIALPKNLKDIVNIYREADLIIPVGGGYIRAQKGLMNTVRLFFIVHPFFFSYILGKKTINYTQSVGPFGNRLQDMISKWSVKTLTGIIVRENISLNLLKKWGITKNVFLSVDSGFSFVSNTDIDLKKELQIPQEQLMVGVTVRTWLDIKQQTEYEKIVAGLCDFIINKYKAAIIFIPQVTVEYYRDDDRESSKRVYGHMKNKELAYVVTKKYDHQTIKAIYADLDYLIGTRFHSVIFGLTSYVPAIAIGYEYKTRGIMIDLGLEQWVVDIGSLQLSRVETLFYELVKNREEYLNQLEKVLPSYIAQSQNSIYIVKSIYENQ